MKSRDRAIESALSRLPVRPPRVFRKHRDLNEGLDEGLGLPRHFEVEALGLRALREAGSGLLIPEVYGWSDAPGADFLLLEELETAPRGPGFDEALGRGLAAIHRVSSDEGFGFELDGYCGLTPQPNPWTPDWPSFYAEHRLGHQLSLARGRMRPELVERVEAVIERLPALLAPGGPSLIHGDLWSGNLLSTPRGPALVDPAPSFSHREAELGMMHLFGGFSDRVYAAYDEAWPLEPGWRDRLDLYALYHALNHFNLFGAGYEAQVSELARGYL